MLYCSFSPNDSSTSILNLESCLNDLYYWCYLNGLALNPDKTDRILFGTRQRANSYTDIATVKSPTPPLYSRIRWRFLELLLTVTIHTMDSQVSDICRSAFYHIRAMRHIRRTITDDVAKTISCSFVTSRLDYVNFALYGISAKNIHPFIACSECRTPWRESFSVLQRPSSATLSICYVICTGYLLNTELSLNLQN